MTDQPAISKKTFNLIAGGAGVLALLVLLFGVLDVKIPSLSFWNSEEEAAPVALHPIHDEASFAALSQKYHVDPPQDPALGFDIQLPKGWSTDMAAAGTQDDDSQRIISEIARLRSPYIGVHRPELIVQTMLLRHDITAAPWLQHYFLSNSYILQGEITADSDRRAHGAFTYINGNQVMLVQAVVEFHGHDAVIARFEMPLLLKESLGFLQARAIQSFALSSPSDEPIEEQKPFTLSNLIKFTYPSSWETAAPDLRDINRISIQLFNRSAAGIYQGYIQIFVVKRRSETSFEKESQRLRDYLRDTLKVAATKMNSSAKKNGISRYDFSRVETYNVSSIDKPSAQPQELTLVALGNNDMYVFILSLSPEAARDIYTWARNHRTMDLIANSIQ